MLIDLYKNRSNIIYKLKIYIYYYMSQIDYNKLFNENFLKNIEIPDDVPKWNIRLIMEKEDHKNITNIFNKNSYNNLNKKEIDVLKKFIESIDLYEMNSRNNIYDKSENTIKETINNILYLPIEELLIYINEIQLNGLFNISSGYFNGEIYLGVSQGKNNITNNTCYLDETFINIYKKIIKESFELYFVEKISEKILDKIIEYELEIVKNKIPTVKRRNVLESINIYDINEIKFNNYNFKKVIELLLKKANVIYPKNKLIFDEKMPFNFYSLIDKLGVTPTRINTQKRHYL
jgi:acetolactate synthase small subunit